jgi:UDP-3-O-[3-hydroxymyristoyl] glucosamine N-acyltransferase
VFAKGSDVVRATLHEQEIREVIGVPGDGDLVVDSVVPVDAAQDRCLSFIYQDVPAPVRESLAAREDCVLIVPKGSALVGELGACRLLQVSDPRAAIAKVLGFIRAELRQPPLVTVQDISPQAVISPLAVVESPVSIGADAVIEPFCTIGPDVVIGRGCTLHAGARIYPRVSLGDASVIGANTVVGHQGYGFVRDDDGNKTRIPHLAGVVIGSHVDIGALAVIQAGVIRATVVEDYAKIDDNVELGHGVRVARNASLTGGVVVAGSAVVGADAWVGINSSIGNGRRVGARSLVGMDASIQEDLASHAVARAPRPVVGTRSPDDDGKGIGFAVRPVKPTEDS